MIEITNKTKSRIDLAFVRKVADKFMAAYRVEGRELSIVFVGEILIRKINNQYRKIDRVTDVLSFEGEDAFLGEIMICYRQIVRQAEQQGKTVKNELAFILVHGLLHLIGYDDSTEKGRQEMIRIGEEFLNKFQITNKFKYQN